MRDTHSRCNRLAVDKSTFEWYKHRVEGGLKPLILLSSLGADDSPPLGTTFGNILNKTANLRMPSQGLTI
jgi:hypothetical protein